MVWRLTSWRCCARACFNLICCSVALACCCTVCVSSQNLTSTRCTSSTRMWSLDVILVAILPSSRQFTNKIASGLELHQSSPAESFGRSQWGKVLLATCTCKARLCRAIQYQWKCVSCPTTPVWAFTLEMCRGVSRSLIIETICSKSLTCVCFLCNSGYKSCFHIWEQALSVAMWVHLALSAEAKYMPVSSALFMVLLIPTPPEST